MKEGKKEENRGRYSQRKNSNVFVSIFFNRKKRRVSEIGSNFCRSRRRRHCIPPKQEKMKVFLIVYFLIIYHLINKCQSQLRGNGKSVCFLLPYPFEWTSGISCNRSFKNQEEWIRLLNTIKLWIKKLSTKFRAQRRYLYSPVFTVDETWSRGRLSWDKISKGNFSQPPMLQYFMFNF